MEGRGSQDFKDYQMTRALNSVSGGLQGVRQRKSFGSGLSWSWEWEHRIKNILEGRGVLF